MLYSTQYHETLAQATGGVNLGLCLAPAHRFARPDLWLPVKQIVDGVLPARNFFQQAGLLLWPAYTTSTAGHTTGMMRAVVRTVRN